MSFWVEMHCDVRGQRLDDCGRLVCHNQTGPHIMSMAGNAATHVTEIRAWLIKRARADGWTRTKDGWCCPACRITMGTGK